MSPHQRVKIFGTKGYIEIEIPFNAPPDRPTRIWHQSGGKTDEIILDTCDQYAIQGDRFSESVLQGKPVPTPLEDAIANMHVIDALFNSARMGSWVDLSPLEYGSSPI